MILFVVDNDPFCVERLSIYSCLTTTTAARKNATLRFIQMQSQVQSQEEEEEEDARYLTNCT
jgi:hypothetical protein